MIRFCSSWLCLVLLSAFSAIADPVVINEIMYHPAPAIPEDTGQEWIELYNKGPSAIDLSGWKFTKGIDFTFSNLTLPAGGYIVVAANLASFSSRYPGVTNVVGNWSGTLGNNGGTIELDDAAGQEVDTVAYGSE